MLLIQCHQLRKLNNTNGVVHFALINDIHTSEAACTVNLQLYLYCNQYCLIFEHIGREQPVWELSLTCKMFCQDFVIDRWNVNDCGIEWGMTAV